MINPSKLQVLKLWVYPVQFDVFLITALKKGFRHKRRKATTHIEDSFSVQGRKDLLFTLSFEKRLPVIRKRPPRAQHRQPRSIRPFRHTPSNAKSDA